MEKNTQAWRSFKEKRAKGKEKWRRYKGLKVKIFG
jgi:hypothetical protein